MVTLSGRGHPLAPGGQGQGRIWVEGARRFGVRGACQGPNRCPFRPGLTDFYCRIARSQHLCAGPATGFATGQAGRRPATRNHEGLDGRVDPLARALRQVFGNNAEGVTGLSWQGSGKRGRAGQMNSDRNQAMSAG